MISLLAFFFIACTNIKQTNSDNSPKLQRFIADTTNNIEAQVDFRVYKEKKELCKRLCLYDLENGSDSFELRFWKEPSMWEPNILYILKGIDTSWLLYHYQLYEHHYEINSKQYLDQANNLRIDSFKVEALLPQKMTWTKYISNLHLDSIWKLPSQSELKNRWGFRDGDGEAFTLELATKAKYKLIHYSNPDNKDEQNHKIFVRFINNLIEPLIYNGMVNPH